MVSLPDFGSWLSRQNEKTQAQVEVLIMLGPFFGAYCVFIYFWVVEMWELWPSLPGPCVIATIGYLAYFRWRESVTTEASSQESLTFTVRWHEGNTETIKNVIAGFESLQEGQAFKVAGPELEGQEYAQTFCPFCGKPVLHRGFRHCGECGQLLPEALPRYALEAFEGLFITRLVFVNVMVDTEGIMWNEGVFIHHAPKDKVFRKVPNQWVAHKGMVLPLSAANVDCVYLGFKEETTHQKFFLVTSDPERCRNIQMGLGLTPADATVEEVNRARILSSIREGIRWMLKYREAEGTNRVLLETREDEMIRAEGDAGEFLGNRRKIQERASLPFKLKENWKLIAGAGVLAGVAIYLLNYLEYIHLW